MPIHTLRLSAIAVLAVLGANTALAQTYPTGLVRMIIPTAAGGGIDYVGRVVADRLGKGLDRTIVPENRPGANGTLAIDALAQSDPDGRTLMVMSEPIAYNDLLYKVRYDMARDITPVAMIARSDFVLVVSKDVPARNLQEFLALARSKPDHVTFGTSGVGSPHQLAMLLLSQIAGATMLHIPFRGGSSDVIAALLRGDIMAAFGLPTSLVPLIQAKEVRGIAVTGKQRMASIPDVPTLTEQGIIGFDLDSWYGVFARKGTPPDAVSLIASVIEKARNDPDFVRERLNRVGLDPADATTPQEFARVLDAFRQKAGGIIKDMNIKVQ